MRKGLRSVSQARRKQEWPQWLPEWSAQLPRPLRAMVRYWINLQDRLEHHAAERRWERDRRNSMR